VAKVQSSDKVWFSHKEKRWKVEEIVTADRIKRMILSWTDEKEIWNYDKCTINIERTGKERKLIVVVRSSTITTSRFMGDKDAKIRFMLGFDVSRVSEPKIEPDYVVRENDNVRTIREGPKNRWVFQLGSEENNDHWIWDWAEEGRDIRSSNIYKLYQSISDEISNPNLSLSNNIFDVELEEERDRVVPVIYQPAVDALDNFVREVHCAKTTTSEDGSYEVEVSTIFNNEELRKHVYANKIYESIRLLLYGRNLDVETFKILVKKDVSNNKFIFENIYSGNSQLEEDTIHGNHRQHDIKYYFNNHNHPVVFINTSNHAMAEHDTNHGIWKWEYLPWLTVLPPIKFGNKTREQIDKKYKPILERVRALFKRLVITIL